MAESIASDLAVKLLGYFGQVAVEKIAPYFGGREKLDELKVTMEMIQARLADAERRREGEDGAAAVKVWLRRLKGVLYKLEDLFEEVSMADRDRDQISGGVFTRRVRILKFNKRLSQDVKAIMREFEETKSIMVGLNLNVGSKMDHSEINPIMIRETHSFVREIDMIGRGNDRDVIVGMLLNSHQDQGVECLSVISIVGIGGLGKTTLAQLCFNDKNVQQHFELKGWACISDTSSLKELSGKILKSLSGGSYGDMSLEEIQSRIRGVINEKRFLIVLDDIWTEDRETWLKVKPLLCGGKQGSKIVVTTRSLRVAEIMGTFEPYQLQGLSDDESWALFESLAFTKGPEERDPRLTSIGREIVNKCVNVPLAIRTIASLLCYRHSEQEWVYFRDNELRTIEEKPNVIMETLKLSYDHLSSQLKQCFAYCSLFPKDYELDKQRLIWLWMAQGFLNSAGNKNPEDVGEEYFMELLRRCFFQDVRRNQLGTRIAGCKMHDLFHDLACKVGDECLLIEGPSQDIKDNIRHLSFCYQDYSSSSKAPWGLHTAKQIRSLLFLRGSIRTFSNNDDLSLRCLRTLHVNSSKFESLSNSIGQLKHLRYLAVLNLSSKSVLDGITKLQNLETLDLAGLKLLRELPRGFDKLTSLRHLQIGDKDNISDMPPRFGDLTSLQTPDIFVVGKNNGLDALGRMSLAGELEISFRIFRENAVPEAMNAKLKDKNLTSLVLNWSRYCGDEEQPASDADKEFECLQPPGSLEQLTVMNWKGVRFPEWGMDELCNLVSMRIDGCRECRFLPRLNRLPHLRFLKLAYLHALEYIENGSPNSYEAAYFLCLEDLELQDLPELKEWSRGRRQYEDENHQPYLSSCLMFPSLSKLHIYDCEKLMSMPLAPKLQSLSVDRIQKQLLNQLRMTKEVTAAAATSPSTYVLELKELDICSVVGLDSLSVNFSNYTERLSIIFCSELMSVTAESSTSLRCLELYDCSRLKDVSGALQHLSVLEELQIRRCEEFDWPTSWVDDNANGDGSETGIAWQGLKTLRHLAFDTLPKLHRLPNLEGLTQLQKLEISDCHGLTALPHSFGSLTQLHELHISRCHGLTSLPHSFGSLTQLQTLEIYNCHGLTALPHSFGSLTQLHELEISHCNGLTALPHSFGSLTQLHELQIKYCRELELYVESSSFGDQLGCLTMLESLVIEELPNLTALPDFIANLNQLRQLEILSCKNAESLGDLRGLTMLESLSLHRLPSLTALPESMEHLSQLRTLSIEDCQNLTSLPDSFRNLTALQTLDIGKCPHLERRYKACGKHWHLIQHVPEVNLS